MVKFNLTGSVQDELEKIAYEKGWFKEANYDKIKEQKTKALQGLLNKFSGGGKNNPLVEDGIWGPKTAGVYSQVMDMVPELEPLYANLTPTNEQITKAFRVLFENLSGARSKEIERKTESAVKGLLPEEQLGAEQTQKTQMAKQQNIDVNKKWLFEKIKYLVGIGYSEEEAKEIAFNELRKKEESLVSKNQKSDDFKYDSFSRSLRDREEYVQPTFSSGIEDPSFFGGSVEKIKSPTKEFPQFSYEKKPEEIDKEVVEDIKPKTQRSKSVLYFQNFVKKYFPQIKVDGVWGPQTNKVWQYIADQYGPSYYSGFASKDKKPSDEVVYRFIAEFKGKIPLPLQPNPYKADDDVAGEKNEEAMELVGLGVPTEEALKQVASNTISKLVCLANELDDVGELKAAIAVDNQINFYKQSMSKLYDITGETGEDLLNSAHKEKVTIAPAKEEGGKVEDLIEQQKKITEIALKNPTGKYAKTIVQLVATANKLEEEGLFDAAKKVDQAIAELQNKFPFSNEKLASEAASFFGKKYASDNEKTIWDDFWSEVHKNAKDLYASILLFSTKVDTNAQGNHFLNLLFNLRRSIHNKEGDLVKEIAEKRAEIVSYVKQNFSKIGIDVGDYVSFLKKLDGFSKVLTSLFVQAKEKIKSLQSTQISQKDPYGVDKSDGQEKNKKNLKWTITKLINIIDDESNRKKLYQSIKPELISGLRQFLLNQYEDVDVFTPEDLVNKNKIFWEIRSELQKQGLSVGMEVERKFKAESSFVLSKIAEENKLENLIKQLIGGGEKQPSGRSGYNRKQPSGRSGYNRKLPSDEVGKLQKLLGVKIDGKYGPKTHSAFQSKLSEFSSGVSLPNNFSDVSWGNFVSAVKPFVAHIKSSLSTGKSDPIKQPEQKPGESGQEIEQKTTVKPGITIDKTWPGEESSDVDSNRISAREPRKETGSVTQQKDSKNEEEILKEKFLKAQRQYHELLYLNNELNVFRSSGYFKRFLELNDHYTINDIEELVRAVNNSLIDVNLRDHLSKVIDTMEFSKIVGRYNNAKSGLQHI